MTTYFINTNARDTPAKISSFLLSVGYEGPEGYYGAPVYCIKIDSQSRTYGFLGAPVPQCKNLTTLEKLKQRLSTQMRIIFVEMLRGDTAEKVLDVMTGLGFSKDPMPGLFEFGEYVVVDTERRRFSYRRDGGCMPTNAVITTLDRLKQLMATHYINVTPSVTLSKITTALYNLGFASCPNTPMPAEVAFLKINKETKTFSCHRDSDQREGVELMAQEQLKPQAKPGPSYEWLEKQCTSLKKQLSALGYEDRGGLMMAPPLGKPPEYILNDLTPEQAIQAFRDGKSVTVAGKPMTSGTTIEELLDSRLTLKHKRFGRIVLTDQVSDAPAVGDSIWAACIDGRVLRINYHETLRDEVINGLFHLTEQGAIDHAQEMARLNRDGFVEMDVEWLVKLKNDLSTISRAIREDNISTAANRTSTLIDEIAKKIGEF